MAIIDVLVPQLSESITEATLLNWKKQPGEAIEADEILIEVETDKVVLEVPAPSARSEEHTSELQSLMRISYAVFCLKKKKKKQQNTTKQTHHMKQKDTKTR